MPCGLGPAQVRHGENSQLTLKTLRICLGLFIVLRVKKRVGYASLETQVPNYY